MAEAKFYTYVHRRADTGEVFYVGKGKAYRAQCVKRRGEFWDRVVAKHGLVIEIVAYFYEEVHAFDHERELIAVYRAAGARLVNLTDGGDGASGAKRSEETKRRMSAAGMGKHPAPHWSEEMKEKARARNLGKRMSAEAIEKTVAFHTGRKRKPETLAKMSAALKGKPGRRPSPEGIDRIRASSTGRVPSAETRAQMSESAKRRKREPFSPEHCANISEARKRYWAEWRAQKEAAPS